MSRKTLLERFDAKFIHGEPNECWIWVASKNSLGYGTFGVVDGVTMLAHRFAWILENKREPLPDMYIMHTCDNPSCVNPAHLKEGTSQENAQDRSVKKRGWRMNNTNCIRGHAYTAENTYIKPTGQRCCKTCKREEKARRRNAVR